ncbi:MFS transporter [Thermobifida halotolerans]|uniref:MFS transporter n=1 Tax=Thermobifida halotolerans TaxID=483545 RepID=A0A399G1Z5_9ACTN|nr:MFS transporter [Thermobifida halotolerans]UOE18644.1 MFS transporter [Thermobifida halotolerans]
MRNPRADSFGHGIPRQSDGRHEQLPAFEDSGHADPPAAPSPPSNWRSGYRDVLRIGEFRALWLAHALSMTGSYLLNIAVAVLVYQRTDSALATGLTLALTFLPPLIAGPLLSGLADLLPRRRIMIVSDVVRAVLVACISIPGLPVGAIWLLLFCSVLPTIPFGAARAALLTQIAQGERFVAGSTLINLTSQAGTLVGLAAGGAVVALIDARPAVLYNGLTFLASAAIIALWVRPRPAPTARESDRPSLWQVMRDGPRLVLTDARLRTLALLAWLAGCYVIPYGIATPMAAEMGGGAATAGLIMAAPSIGAILGGLPLTRLVSPETRTRLLGPLAVVASLPLVAWVLEPPLWAMVLLLVVSGMAASYQFVANATFVLCAPSVGRGAAFGLVAAGLQVAQGISIAVASFLVEHIGAHLVIASAGAVGALGAAALALPWSRLSPGAVRMMQDGPER